MLNKRRDQPADSRALAPAVAGQTIAGMGWLVVGLAAGWLVFATPILARAVSLNSRSAAAPLLGAAVWAVALTAPTVFVVLGTVRLAGVAAHLRGRAGPARPVHAMAARLPAGVETLPTICLPDGRRVPDVVLGPHGIAFFEPLPPPTATRHLGGRWEARFADGTWRPIENPLDRAARTADSLRRFLAQGDRDFVVKVHPAVTSNEPQVERTVSCAVVALRDVPSWIAALPAQRGLSPDRLQHVRELLHGLASGA
jgi:hypothetical protein